MDGKGYHYFILTTYIYLVQRDHLWRQKTPQILARFPHQSPCWISSLLVFGANLYVYFITRLTVSDRLRAGNERFGRYSIRNRTKIRASNYE